MGGIARPLLPLIIMVAVMVAVGPAAAQYDAALFAFNRGDYATAARQFKSAARDGDSDAQYWLGRIYADGLGRPRDPVTAYGWFDRAAAQGHHDAAILRDGLARLLAPVQITEARRRTDLAAPAGNQEAHGSHRGGSAGTEPAGIPVRAGGRDRREPDAESHRTVPARCRIGGHRHRDGVAARPPDREYALNTEKGQRMTAAPSLPDGSG